MVSRKAERIMRIITREREERARETAADAAHRANALAAIERLQWRQAAQSQSEDYDAWWASIKPRRRKVAFNDLKISLQHVRAPFGRAHRGRVVWWFNWPGPP